MPRTGVGSLAPTEPFRTRRALPEGHARARDGARRPTGGTVRITDFMTPRRAQARVVRLVEGARGVVRIRSELLPRFDYGLAVPWLREVQPRACVRSPARTPCDLRTEAPLDVTTGTVASESHGPRRAAGLVRAHVASRPTSRCRPRSTRSTRSSTTVRYWTRWSARCEYRGEWRDAVMRSLITLKALTYRRPAGSSPHRRCRCPRRSAARATGTTGSAGSATRRFTLYGLLMAGYDDEAEAWREWLLRAVAGDPRDLRIMYGIARGAADPRDGASSGSPATRRRSRCGSATTRRAVPARRLRRDPGPLVPVRARGLPHEGGRVGDGAADHGCARVGLARARRRDLGGARRAPAVHPLEDDGVGRGRPRDPRSSSCSGSTARSNAGGRSATRSTMRSAARATTRTSTPSRRPTGRAIARAALLMMPLTRIPAGDRSRACSAPSPRSRTV